MTLEDQAKARFANVQRMINQTEQEIVELGHEKRDMMDVREFNLGRLQVQRRYLAELDNEIMAAQSRLRDLHSEHQKSLERIRRKRKKRRKSLGKSCATSKKKTISLKQIMKNKNSLMRWPIAPSIKWRKNHEIEGR